MYRTCIRSTAVALGTLLVGSTLVMAAGLQGVVTGVDGKGMATVRTSDNKEHQVKAGEGLKAGVKVECEMKNNAMECRPAQPHAAASPAPSTSAPAKQAPAPTTSTPAPMTPAPAASTPAPSTSAPATGSK